MQKKSLWIWRPKRWWVTIILIWLISNAIFYILFSISDGWKTIDENTVGDIILKLSHLLYTVFIVWCSATDRGWKIIYRILWVIGLMFGRTFLAILFGLMGVYGGSAVGLIDVKLFLLASIPFLILAMRRSTVFVEKINNDAI